MIAATVVLLMPGLGDLNRFPTYDDSCIQIALSEQLQPWIRAQIEIDIPNRLFWQKWYEDNVKFTQAWMFLQHARSTTPSKEYRRLCMYSLRGALGQEAYAHGMMPQQSLWRFADK